MTVQGAILKLIRLKYQLPKTPACSSMGALRCEGVRFAQDLVDMQRGAYLARPCNVARHLRLDLVQRLGAVLGHVRDRPRTGPAERVQTGVHHQPARPHHVHRQAAKPAAHREHSSSYRRPLLVPGNARLHVVSGE